MTRVLLLTDEMEIGGTQRQIVHIAKGLDRARFEPTVAYFRNRSFLVDELEKAGVPVTEVAKRGRFDPGFIRRLAAFVRNGNFDVMHCFAFTGELWGAVARRLVPSSRRPALITSVRNKYDWYTPLQWKLKRWAARESCRVIANSQAGSEYAREKMALAAGAIEVVYNGVAEASGRPKARAPGRDVRVLFVGRLVEQKNAALLLKALKRLLDEKRSIRLHLAGDGPLRAQCEALARELGIDGSVEFLGHRSDTGELMADADFVVLPSVREGLSNVILEAMMAGRAVIASAVGGNIELVEPMHTGLLFPNGDDAALAEAMRRLSDDVALREALGQKARARALERFSVASMVKAMEGHYAGCAQGAAR
jgi:glycosyltransferase involved in cell wall biosynthesis